MTITYSSDFGPDAATTARAALTAQFETAGGQEAGFTDSTFTAERSLESGAVEFAAQIDGKTRAIVTVEPIGGGKYWAVTGISACEKEFAELASTQVESAK
jgi:hypothetical protein